MLMRMYLAQCWFNLPDEAAEDALWDSRAVRAFVGCGEGCVSSRAFEQKEHQ